MGKFFNLFICYLGMIYLLSRRNTQSLCDRHAFALGLTHTMALWQIGDLKKVTDALSHEQSLRIVSMIQFTLPRGQVKTTLDRFYWPQKATHGNKGAEPFVLFVIEDLSPRHHPERLRDGSAYVNTNMYELKQRLRSGHAGGGYLHASNNVEESYVGGSP